MPESLIQSLPLIIKRKITNPPLKQSEKSEQAIFSKKVLSFLNPKFEDEMEYNISLSILMDFCSDCELTDEEYLQALKMSADGKLTLEENGEAKTIKLFREIDNLKLREVKRAYIQYRNHDINYNKGKKMIDNYLNPPLEKTKEEKEKEKIDFLKKQYQELQNIGCPSAFILFYPHLKKDLKIVSVEFIEQFLINYKPEKREGFLYKTNIVKCDAFTEFKKIFTSTALKYKKLNELTINEWIKYWINLL